MNQTNKQANTPKEQNKSWVERFRERFVKKPVDWRENGSWNVPYVDSQAKDVEEFFQSELSAFAKEMLNQLNIGMVGTSEEAIGYRKAVSQTRQAQMEIIKKYEN